MCMTPDQCNRMMSASMDTTKLKAHCRLQNKTLCTKDGEVECVESRDVCQQSGGSPPQTKGLCDTEEEVVIIWSFYNYGFETYSIYLSS